MFGPLTRRRAIGHLAAMAAITALPRRLWAEEPMPTIGLGKTGRTLPRLGLGCFPVGNLPEEADALAVLRRAMDLGVRYLDTAPSYGDGRSERRVGAGLKAWLADNAGATRRDFYVATKTLKRDADGARRELEASLKRLGLEYVDCIQCHEVHDDWEMLFKPGGAVEGLNRARDEGLVRHVGITGHRNPKYIRACIERMPPKDDGSGFVTALVPVNPVDVQHMSFVRDFLPRAAELGVAAIAMKIFGGGFLLSHQGKDGKPAYSAGDLVRYSLAQPGVAVAVPGCDRIEHIEQDYAAVSPWVQPTAEWLTEQEHKAPPHEGKKTEWYKDEKVAEPPAAH